MSYTQLTDSLLNNIQNIAKNYENDFVTVEISGDVFNPDQIQQMRQTILGECWETQTLFINLFIPNEEHPDGFLTLNVAELSDEDFEEMTYE